eukprot:TRINITY_DN12445_c0_g1_i17.p1 TRINITY_DN12445_c0_g1~~TRINITY_DN12445_c0_g1_i17.p1  ORF type:complete len:371 (+),score=98.65 TRINITY_DN12445_c0_g1_i17:148-1260(+)
MIRRPPRSTLSSSSAASDVYKRQEYGVLIDERHGGFAHKPSPMRVPQLMLIASMATAAPVDPGEWSEVSQIATHQAIHAELGREVSAPKSLLPEELAEMMAEVGKIPASVLDRLAEQVKPCKENAANCRYTSVNAPKCEAREEFLKIRVELKTQQLAFYNSGKAAVKAKDAVMASYQKANSYYQNPKVGNLYWSQSPNTPVNDPKWGTYASMVAATRVLQRQLASKAAAMKSQNVQFKKMVQMYKDAYKDMSTKCEPATPYDMQKVIAAADAGDDSELQRYLSLPYFKCQANTYLNQLSLIDSLGQSVQVSACSNFGFSEDGCKQQCATTKQCAFAPVSYTHLRAHETPEHLVCRLLLEKKKKKIDNTTQ